MKPLHKSIYQPIKNHVSPPRARRGFPALFLIAALVLAFASAPSHAQPSRPKQPQKQLQNEITLSASVGTGNTFFPQQMNPVDITVNNGTSANFEGEILIEAAGRRYRMVNVFVGPLSSKKYSVHARFDSYAYQVKISIINSSNIVIYNEDIKVSPNQPNDYFVYSVSETPSFISAIKGIRVTQKRKPWNQFESYGYSGYSAPSEGADPRVNVHNVKPEEMFSNFACYEPYSLVILNGADVSLMSRDQQRALIEYVRGGGTLMVSYGGFVSRISTSELAAILPVTISGSEVFDGSDFYRYAASRNADGAMSEKFAGIGIPISVGDARDGAVATLNLTAPGGRIIPLIAHARAGNGRVYYTAFDISQVDISRVDYLKDNIAAILRQSETNKDFMLSSVASCFNRYCEKFNQFVTDPPSALGVVLILVIFAGLTGPAFYFFIRNRVNMLWLTAGPVVISASFFALFNSFDIEFLLDRPLVAELNLRMIDNESASSQHVSGVAILMPPMAGGEYSVDQGRATLMGNARSYYSQEESEIIINEDMVKLVHPQMNYRFSKYAVVRQDRLNGKFGVSYSSDAAEAGQAKAFGGNVFAKTSSSNALENEMMSYIEAASKNKKARKLLSIVNNTDLDLEGCRVYYCGHIFKIDALAPGSKAELSSASPSSFDSPRAIEDHFDAIASCVRNGLPAKLRREDASYAYNGDAFVKLAGLYIARTNASAPVLVGYIKKSDAAGEAVKTSGCDVSDLGTIALIKL